MRVWITGASSGIGEACAYRYASMGCSLILTSTSREKLKTVAAACMEKGAAEAVVVSYDFSCTDGIEAMVNDCWNKIGPVDILFCNAGISQRTNVQDTSEEMLRKIMEINYFSPAIMSRAILPLMLGRGHGKIAVTSSIAGRFGFPLRCGYSSSKFALYGFFESMRAEYSSKGIDVTIVCPGRVRTNISLNALDKGGAKYGKMDPGQEGGLSSDKAAARIVKAIGRGRREVLVGRGELAMVYVKRFIPGLCAWISTRIKPV